jgi:hypothetical protein
MTKEEKAMMAKSIGDAGADIWRAAMTLLKVTDPEDPEDTPTRNAAEILSSLGYIIDQCVEMINPKK